MNPPRPRTASGCPASSCAKPATVDFEQSSLVERHHAESFLRERLVPGAEVHEDRDVVWVVHGGQAWRNAAIMVRFSQGAAARRLDTLLSRYREHGRGMALWLAPATTPADLPHLLQARGLRCQKYFPAMLRNLRAPAQPRALPRGLEIRPITDASEFERVPHPAIGPITTPLRRRALDRLRAFVTEPSARTHSFVAWLRGSPVGALELFAGKEAAGVHGLTVLDSHEGQGIGSALIERACQEAKKDGARTMVLLASSEGQRLYERSGFKEVGRIGYWYRSFQRQTQRGGNRHG